MSRALERPAHPYLAALYSVLALVAANLHERIRPADVWLPLLIAVAVAAIGWLASGLATRDPHRRGVLALGAVVLFSAYGALARLLAGVAFDTALARELAVLGLLTLAAAAVITGVLRSHRSLASLTRFLNVMTGILLLFPALAIGRAAAAAAEPRSPAPSPPLPAAIGAGRSDPDIWLILLDAYSSNRNLREQYGFDNGPFADSLRARGFFVPEQARSNYVLTFLAVAAMLEWSYLDEVVERLGPASTDRSAVYRLVEDNRTVRFLKERGYRFVFARSAYPVLNRNAHADVPIPPLQAGEFTRVWATETALRSVAVAVCLVLRCRPGTIPFAAESASEVSKRFELLAEAATLPGPKLVLAHFLLPHEPLIFAGDCEPLPVPLWPLEPDAERERVLRRAYIEQVRCTNRKLLTLVDAILERSSDPPVILIQSDHGLGHFGRPVSLDGVEPARVRDRVSVFAAYRFPEGGADGLYDSVTPVNALRVTMSKVFELDLPPLEDRTYWSSWERPYRLTRVDAGAPRTDRSPGPALRRP